MGHVGHERTLHHTRLIGAFRLALQLFLFLDEGIHVAHDAITAHQSAVLVERRDAVDEVPLQARSFVEEGVHLREVCPRHIEIVLEVQDAVAERTVHEIGCQLVEGQFLFRRTHALVEGDGMVDKRCAEETHVAVVHQVLQFRLVLLDGLVCPADGLLVFLVLQIQVALLGDVAHGEGDVEQCALIVVERVYVHLGIAVHASLDDHTLRTEEQFLDTPFVQYLPEGGHVVDGVVEIERVVLRLELHDLLQLLVGGDQSALVVVEGQSRDRLFEDSAVLVGHLFFGLFLLYLVGDVVERAVEGRGGLAVQVHVFGDARVVDIAPLTQVLLAAHVPAERTFCRLVALGQFLHAFDIEMPVVRVDICQTFLIAHAVLGQEVAVQVVAHLVLQSYADDAAPAHIQRVL